MKSASIKVMLHPDKLEDNTFSICFRIFKNDSRKYIYTAYPTKSILSKFWSEAVWREANPKKKIAPTFNAEWVTKGFANYKNFNNFLLSELSEITKFVVKEEEKNPHISSSELKRKWETRNVIAVNTSSLLTFGEACRGYQDFLNNIGVPEHKQKPRTDHHKNEVERFFRYAQEVIDPGTEMSSIGEDLVGNLHKYIIGEEGLDFEPSTYNKFMGLMNTLYKHYKINPNPFQGIAYFDDANDELEAVDINEFFQMLETITYENGITEYKEKNVKKRRTRYFEGCKEGFELFLYTGRRREEVLSLKWSHIYHENGEPVFIKSEDLKADRIKGKHKKEKPKFIRIPITVQLKELLFRIGYAEYKDTDKYILHPDSPTSRRTLMDKYSRAFSHYWGRLYPGSNITLMNLRKTYMTYLMMLLEGDAPKISGHSGMAVMNKHYKDKDLVVKTAKGLKIG